MLWWVEKIDIAGILAQVLAQKNRILMHIAYGIPRGIPRFFEYHVRPINANIPILHELQGRSVEKKRTVFTKRTSI
jgi:hypothetical protein